MTDKADEREAAARPVLSRRREVGGGSARSLLITVLGEYVLPADVPVWTSTLVTTLGLFGIEEKSARQALARTAAEGWMSSDRVGRRVRWRLTAPGRRLLAEGAERIYGFGSGHESWDGRWLIVLTSVPESQRDVRHKLRTQLTWAGFGALSPGTWISPRTESEVDAKAILDELGLTAQSMSFVASYGALGEQQDMVSAAWDLGAVEERYEQFIEEFRNLNPVDGDDVLTAQIRLIHEWRRFPFLDPQLPSVLLPPRWSGTAATELFTEKHNQWREPALRRWTEL